MTNIEIVRSPHAPNAKMPVFGVSGVGCAAAQPAQPAQPPPMAYMTPDPLPPPWYWATDFYRRKRRRPRCDGED